ncbi:cyclic nucleotide-binding domain-containing protein (plasmid) [Streptomyces sp. BHT-5-2]|uniref:cyclic nucleotide-binding domain-containing protein n=1 Tax=unclassified Streptomyces TaxID=2593676 RepID=UPI001C8DBEB6|nr:cyclic nucleotide-binding domain-containing protein [Streptomyces sp. BHT-5-2]QZL08907.1 cyclic nucleotide-binding domain-containing protein [Streptomyces sp. BHT-5-2]
MTTTPLLHRLPPDGRERLLAFAHEVSFPEGTRIFEEGGAADQFWIIRTGSVNLDVRLPGRRPAVVEPLGPGDLLGWSWLVPPYRWRMGAEAFTLVRAHEFDATAVRALCEADPALGLAVTRQVLDVVARRLLATRHRLVDLAGAGASLRPGPT